MTPGDTYHDPDYGEGVVISETPEIRVVRFDNPPGMSKDAPRARIVPVVHFREEQG